MKTERKRLELAKPEPADTFAELVQYILQDDIHNRLTPRIVDIAYYAFMLAKQGKNKDDGGPCDWFNDTKPMVMEQLDKIKKDLAEEARHQLRKPPTDGQIEELHWGEMSNRDLSFARAVLALVGIGSKP